MDGGGTDAWVQKKFETRRNEPDYSRDAGSSSTPLALLTAERVAAFIYIGSAKEKPAERERPGLDSRFSRWNA